MAIEATVHTLRAEEERVVLKGSVRDTSDPDEGLALGCA